MNKKYNSNAKSGKSGKMITVLGLLVCAAVLMMSVVGCGRRAEEAQESTGANEPGNVTVSTAQETEESSYTSLAVLQEGIEVLSIGSYTGLYMEDGSDEVLGGILMMKVTNTGKTPIQYGEITMAVGEETAEFSLSTLMPGATMVLLERNRMAYDAAADYTAADISSKNVALFREEMSLHADQLEIQIMDGAINVTNISGSDISGNIAIYYKNAADGVYYGGITYRITLEGGLKADEVRQLMASHFSDTGSEIMFVTISK